MTPTLAFQKPDTQLASACRLSLLMPLLQLIYVRAGQIHQHPDVYDRSGVGGWLASLSEVAAAILKDADRDLGTPGELAHAKRVAMRMLRIMQGYEPAANDKAYQELYAHLEQQFGEVSEEMAVALNNGMVYAMAARNAYLDHVAGALVPLEPKTPKARL